MNGRLPTGNPGTKHDSARIWNPRAGFSPRRLARLVALALAFLMVPGAVELVESAVHLVDEGHLPHAVVTTADGDEHAPTDPEHGCTPSFHLCACHSGLSYFDTSGTPVLHIETFPFSAPSPSKMQTPGFYVAVERPPRV